MAYGDRGRGGVSLYFTFENSRKEDDAAEFSVYHGIKKEIIDRCTFVEGNLVGIKFGEGDYEGDKYKTCVVSLQDPESKEYYRIKCRFDKMTQIMRGLLNRLLTLKSCENIKISYYGNKGEYKNVSVRQNDEKVEWMFQNDALKPYIFPIEDRKGNVLKNDYTDLDNFFQEQVEAILVPLMPEPHQPKEEVADGSKADNSHHTEAPQSTDSNPFGDTEPIPTDDLPF